jgi:purine/pyrimidine-nucleoside phosphorylase
LVILPAPIAHSGTQRLSTGRAMRCRLPGRGAAAAHSFTTIQRNTAMTAAIQFDQVSVIKRANVYFDGKCVSHTVLFADGSRKTLGVILPGTLNFGTDAPELMEVQAGQCRIRLDGSAEWQTYKAGDSFSVPGKSRFDIDVIETLDYVCSYL